MIDLRRVLTNVKARGTWGEVQLAALLANGRLPALSRQLSRADVAIESSDCGGSRIRRSHGGCAPRLRRVAPGVHTPKP